MSTRKKICGQCKEEGKFDCSCKTKLIGYKFLDESDFTDPLISVRDDVMGEPSENESSLSSDTSDYQDENENIVTGTNSAVSFAKKRLKF